MNHQKLIIITGSPCVGKTAVAEKLLDSLENCAYLNGDWCWCVNPFSLEDKRLRNGDKSMSYILANYLNSGFDYVIFDSLVAAFPDIRENILRNIRAETYDMIGITLTCSEETLTRRRNKRGDSGEISFYWLHLPPCSGDHVINTDGKSTAAVLSEIKKLL